MNEKKGNDKGYVAFEIWAIDEEMIRDEYTDFKKDLFAFCNKYPFIYKDHLYWEPVDENAPEEDRYYDF